jgi:hypothetical protein
MKPEIAKIWDTALTKLKKAKEHLHKGEDKLAISEAKDAWCAGLITITILWYEDKWGKDRVLERIFRKGRDPFLGCSDPEDYVMRAEKLLKDCVDLCPRGETLPYP